MSEGMQQGKNDFDATRHRTSQGLRQPRKKDRESYVLLDLVADWLRVRSLRESPLYSG